MRRIHSLFVFALLMTVSMVCAGDIPGAAKPADSDSVFGPTRLWKIHLHVTAENWKAMQPPARGGFPGFGPPPAGPAARPTGDAPPTPVKPPVAPAARPGSFGFDFEYVKAEIELDGEALHEVGLRFKGNGSYMLSQSTRKRPFKIDFNRFDQDQRFHGLQQLNLHNNVMDPTHVRQALSYPVFQAAGIPAPRTAFAEVLLTIDGECDHEPLGLYTLVEEIDKAFLKRHYDTSKGMLLKPEGTQGMEYKGEDFKDYSWFEPKSKPSEEEAQHLIEFTRLIHKADDEQFRREIGSLLDTDQFARFLAVNTLLANMDSFLTQVHNYYVYLPPQTKKFEFLPWDMDLSLGAFPMAGSAEQLQDLSISHPHVGQNKLVERLLAWKEFDQVYCQHLKELTESQFGEQGVTRTSLPIMQAAIHDLVEREKQRTAQAQAARGPGGFGGPGMFGGPQPSIETFFDKRRASITAQLAGTSKGREPGMSFGPPGGGPGRGPGGGFGPGNFHGPQFLTAGDADKNQKLSREEFTALQEKWLTEWDKDTSDSLDKEEFTAGLNAALGTPGGSAPGGVKPPAGFGPGMFLSAPFLNVSDTDKDGHTSKVEWASLFESWFKSWDKGQDESLDSGELVAGLNAAFGPPPGAGPPGFGRPPLPTGPPAAPRQ